MLQATYPRATFQWRRGRATVQPFPLLVANLQAPTVRADRGGQPTYRIELPTGLSVETRLESLRRSADCMPPILAVERSEGRVTAVFADEGWSGVVEHPLASAASRHACVSAFLRLLLTLERSQPWMAQLSFRPEHLELRDAHMRLTVAGVAWIVQAPLCLQACPLRMAAGFLDLLFPHEAPVKAVAQEWRTSTRLTLAAALVGWSELRGVVVPRRQRPFGASLLLGAVLLGAAALPLVPLAPMVAPRSPLLHHRAVVPMVPVTPVVAVQASPRALRPTFVDTLHRRLTDRDLTRLSARDLTLLRNQIYARHGRSFEDPELRNWFNAQPWYNVDPAYRDSNLSRIELDNAAFINAWQIRHHLTW